MNSRPAQDFGYAFWCFLYVLWEKPDFLSRQQPAPEVLDWGKLHFLFVFTVNIQEDAKEHQKATPDVPKEGETERLDIFEGTAGMKSKHGQMLNNAP